MASTRAGEDAECSSDNGACKRVDSGGWSTEADAFLSSSRCNIRKVYMRWQDGGISAENFRKYRHLHPMKIENYNNTSSSLLHTHARCHCVV